MHIEITQIIVVFVTLLSAVMTGILFPLIRSKVSAARWELMKEFAVAGVQAAEILLGAGTERKNLNKPSGISSSNAKSMESKSMRMPFRLPSKMRGSHWDWMKSILKNRLLQQKGGENVGDSQRRSVSGTTEGTR